MVAGLALRWPEILPSAATGAARTAEDRLLLAEPSGHGERAEPAGFAPWLARNWAAI